MPPESSTVIPVVALSVVAAEGAPPTVVAPIDLLRLSIVVLIGVFFYSEQGDVFIYFGAALIIFANWLNLKKANT